MITENSRNVLIADDSTFFRVKLGDILVDAGHKVRFATDGKEVIKEIGIDSGGIDLLVLDMQMPGMDGFGVLEWIKENGHGGKFPILVVTSAYELADIMVKSKELGAAGLMTKSFTPEEILFRANRFLFPEKATGRETAEERAILSVPAEYTIGEEVYTGFLLNISLDGVFLHTRVELLIGTSIALSFSLPGSDRLFDVKGIVKWSTGKQAEKTFFGGYGVMFSTIEEDEKRLIEAFIKSEAKKVEL